MTGFSHIPTPDPQVVYDSLIKIFFKLQLKCHGIPIYVLFEQDHLFFDPTTDLKPELL